MAVEEFPIWIEILYKFYSENPLELDLFGCVSNKFGFEQALIPSGVMGAFVELAKLVDVNFYENMLFQIVKQRTKASTK